MFDIKPDSRMSTEERLLFNIQELLIELLRPPEAVPLDNEQIIAKKKKAEAKKEKNGG